MILAIDRYAAGPRDTSKLAMRVRCKSGSALRIFFRAACQNYGDDDIDGAPLGLYSQRQYRFESS